MQVDSITTAPTSANIDEPGVQEYPFTLDDMTEAEYAIVAALREARRCEASWDEYHKRDAWRFIRNMAEGILNGEDLESLQLLCDPHQFPAIYAAALASANAIKFLTDGWKQRRQ